MTHTPSYRELQRIFELEAQAIEYLQGKEVLPKQMKCSKCNQNMTLNDTVFNCVKRACRKRMSIFTNTVFYGVNTPCNHIFKELVSFNLEEEHQQIGGQDIIVEIDKSKFGTRKTWIYNEEINEFKMKLNYIWVFGGVERTPQQKMFAMIVEDRSADKLLKQIDKHIHPESVIYSDIWKGYQNIYSWLGIQHHAVNHSQGFTMKDTNPVTEEIQVYHTNTIVAHWQVIKSKIPPRERCYLFTELLTAKISDPTGNTDIIEEIETDDNDQTEVIEE
ncbi:11305_t:CDS:2 [Ambispora leptoticha]|uniref:11305_t:CDS:1 n=1 Tax=Ambispora leptoticha TaxID=144679 RepID=A0A9N9DAJ0_9GLOM|nr:11305_t:CDS:2 [Ambispora leptoticha]